MRSLLPLLVFLACPLMMIFMMRGMHGGKSSAPAPHEPASEGSDAVRIAALEREVADLRAAQGHAPVIRRHGA